VISLDIRVLLALGISSLTVVLLRVASL
jgi:hypothetical protein